MSLAEQLPLPEYQPTLSAPQEIANAALMSLSLEDSSHDIYKPDYMSEEFANEVAQELYLRGVDATVLVTRLKTLQSRQGSSFAIDIEARAPSNVIPFPTRF